MSNRSRRKIHSQTSNQKPRQKQPGLLREESKQQQQQQSSQEHHDLQYPTQGQQNPVVISDEPPQQLLPYHPMLPRRQYLGQHVYGREQHNYFYPYITAEQVRAWNDYLWRQQREKKLQSLTSFLYSENSFLTPWSWNPEAPRPEEKRPMMFQPGSFFSYHIPPPQAKVEEQHSRQSQSSKQP
ncbi:hypothetical protein OIU79_016946 [Salix purpurea]|uniref:Uncharacterized protein n=1 Tax=Salix purpurea TaxID=77065 RepID=A0A9Q0WWC5_SALPP|nr:hypothetical protein OIU79_016946 [Salix purpurea]